MAISKKVAHVLKGVTELNSTERVEFISKVNDFLSNDPTKRRVFNEDLGKGLQVTTGPSPASCPCCGR